MAAAVVAAVIAAAPGLSAASTPSLAAITPAQLIAKVEQTKVTSLSGSLNVTPNLGIPNLSALTNAAGAGGHSAAFSPTDLLSGTHQALVWVAGPEKNRVALLQSLAETDVVHNGHDVWLWDSTSKKVTHYTAAAGTQAGAKAGAKETPAADPAEAVQTPQQVADKLLAQITPSTTVSVGSTVTVAKQNAYQLILAPHSAASTIDHAAIAVDSVTGLPLQVEIFAKGQKKAALKLGFGKINYATPAASEFAFKAPPGSTVTNKTVGGSGQATPAGKSAIQAKSADANAGDQVTVGQDWTSVAIFRGVQVPKQLNQYLQAATSVMNGQGKLLETSLVNVLVMNDGRVAVGAVNASTLEAAVAAAP